MPSPNNKAAASTRRETPSLSAKMQPAQQRAAETYERILEVTAQTLADVGIERLSTNLVCERAGLTPPALYRYFPNKYALLCELGQRLMQQQNERVSKWIGPDVFGGEVAHLELALEGLILDTYEVTEQTVGGVWIMRALRAVPALQEVRLDSHTQVTRAQTRLLAQALPHVSKADLELTCRVVVELIYATVEMLSDERRDVKAVARTVASMIASQLERLRSQSPEAPKKAARKRPARV
ncbi:TetR/AcrR family transcriptional regulator (plasmid) [Ralstonia sp. R-29]|uniref:TetR/AcrR family transcriptional regulator n=1 Tax=Ralstonia sp. R-29 TaxID=3404059 RepID=UPI003CF80FA6